MLEAARVQGAGEPFDREPPAETDVLIIGGGIAGCSTLHHLVRRGVEATLIEQDRVGGGATAAAVGVLSPPLRQPFHETAHRRGEDAARAIWELCGRSVKGLAAALEEEGAAGEAALDLSGGHVLAEGHSHHAVRRSFEALERVGIAVEWLEGERVRAETGGRGFTGGYRLEGGGSLSPGPAAVALARGARARGARVVEGVEALAVERAPGGITCHTPSGDVKCRRVVYATHVESRRFSTLLGEEIVPIRGQGLALQAPPGPRIRGGFATHWKLNVWRRAPSGDVILGGWRHDAWDRAYGQREARIDERLQRDLLEWSRSMFPEWGEPRVAARWSGVFGWTADYLPLVGPLSDAADELVIAGFSGGGLPFAFECGRALAAMIVGDDPVPGAELLNPRRFA